MQSPWIGLFFHLWSWARVFADQHGAVSKLESEALFWFIHEPILTLFSSCGRALSSIVESTVANIETMPLKKTKSSFFQKGCVEMDFELFSVSRSSAHHWHRIRPLFLTASIIGGYRAPVSHTVYIIMTVGTTTKLPSRSLDDHSFSITHKLSVAK